MSLHMIPRARWHSAMKAPPCMRWRGLHPAFVARAARFLGPISHLSAFTEPLAILKRRLPNASAAVSRPREVSPAVPIPPRRPSVSVTSIFYSCRASPARGSTNVFKISDVSTAHPQNPTSYPPSSQFSSQVVHIQGRGQTQRWLTPPLQLNSAGCRPQGPQTRPNGCRRSRVVGLPGRQLSCRSWRRGGRSAARTRRDGDRPAIWMTTCCPPSRVPGREREPPRG